MPTYVLRLGVPSVPSPETLRVQAKQLEPLWTLMNQCSRFIVALARDSSRFFVLEFQRCWMFWKGRGRGGALRCHRVVCGHRDRLWEPLLGIVRS